MVASNNILIISYFMQFYDAAREVIKSSDDNVRGVFEAYETLSKTVTSRILEEMADGKQYPPGFVTLPNAEHIIGNARKISKALGCSYHVIVEPENREAWLNYSKANIGWWRESWAVEPFVFNGTVEEVPDDYVPPLEPWELYTKDADGNDIIQDPNACRNTNNFEIAQQGIRIRDPSKLSLPMWTVSPPFPPSNQNVNLDFADTPWVALPVNVSAKFRQSTFHDTCIDSLVSFAVLLHLFLSTTISNSWTFRLCSLPQGQLRLSLLSQFLNTLMRVLPLLDIFQALCPGSRTFWANSLKALLLYWLL
jgi:hypothetical protein